MKKPEQWITDLVYALRFPTVAHPMWARSIPDDLRSRLPIIRMVQILREPGQFRHQATDEEAMLYLMTTSLAFPLNSDWASIYMYVTRKYTLQWLKVQEPELPDFLKEEIKLDDYRQSMLSRLKAWIRKKQIKHMKAKERQVNHCNQGNESPGKSEIIHHKPDRSLMIWCETS